MPLIKRAKALFCGLFVIASLWTAAPASAAGTLPLAMAQQIDINGQPLAGCQVYFFVAGTPSSPQNAFSDFSLAQSLGPQIQCDQSGRVPMFWLADGLIHVRLTDSSGGPIIDTTMQVLGPSSGGGGGGSTVDPTALLATGDMKAKYAIGPLAGFVRANGLTIGNATSGATERANADTQALFIFLYGQDPNLVVSGGRTGNALNDYNANKTMALPDWRGQTIGALADMGNSATSVLTAFYFGTNPTVLGAAGGLQSNPIVMTNLPASPAPVAATTSTWQPTINGGANIAVSTGVGAGSTTVSAASPTVPVFQSSTFAVMDAMPARTVSGNTANLGSGTPFPTVGPMKLATVYIKL